MRDIPAHVEMVHRGEWKPSSGDAPGYVYGDLTSRQVGLASFGSINRRYCEPLMPFHCKARSYDPFVGDEMFSSHGVARAPSVDVFEPEPPPGDAWFRRHPNVLPTPYIAGDTVFCHHRCFTGACRDAIAILQGERPRFQATS